LHFSIFPDDLLGDEFESLSFMAQLVVGFLQVLSTIFIITAPAPTLLASGNSGPFDRPTCRKEKDGKNPGK